MIKFSLLGETILEWDANDLENYHSQRMVMDSILCGFKKPYPSERIDSLRFLLEDKEVQMRKIVQVLEKQDSINKKIAGQVPVIAKKSAQEQPVKPKRKGFLGIFGKKEKPKQTTATTMVYTLHRDAIAQQRTQSRRLSEHADSLAARNGELNYRLQELISHMDTKVYQDLQNREAEIMTMRENSYMLVGSMTAIALVLLLISYIIIHRNNRRINRYEKETEELIGRLQQSVRANEELIASRKKRKIKRSDFEKAMTASGLNEKVIQNMANKFGKAISKWIDLIDNSFLPNDMKREYKRLIIKRVIMMR